VFPVAGARARCLNRFERDFGVWLKTPDGRFATYEAQRKLLAPTPQPQRTPRTSP
jgi:hypothetical protein